MYCRTHSTNNCIECAIERQTEKIIEAIEVVKRKTPSMPFCGQCGHFQPNMDKNYVCPVVDCCLGLNPKDYQG